MKDVQEHLRDAMLRLKSQHAIDPKSVTAGDIIAILDILAGYALGHHRSIHDVTDALLDAARQLDRVDKEVAALKFRARRWKS